MNTANPLNNLTPDKHAVRDDNLGSEQVTDTNTTVFNRIISKNVHEYHFIIPNDKRVELGQIFSIEDDEITFLARVTDIQHESNYSGKWDTTLKGIDFYDKDQYFNKIIAESFGCVVLDEKTGKKKIKKSKTIPKKFSNVKDADQDELKFLADEMGDIEVGYLRSGSRKVKEVPVSLKSEVMDHHMGIFATTGMGKSNFMKVFTASCIKKAAQNPPDSSFGLLIVDPHGEYFSDLRRIQTYKDGLVCYTTRKGVSGAIELKVSKEDISPDDVKILRSDLTNPQKEILDTIMGVIDEPEWQSNGGGWIDKLLDGDGVEILIKKKERNETPIRNLRNKIDTLIRRRMSWIDVHSSIPGIIKRLSENKVVLIDMPGMSEGDELFLLSILSKRILDQYKEFSSNNERRCCLITIEEAQRVLSGGEGSVARFETIAREGRKFGVGLCAITQQPKLIDKQLLSQFNTLVVMGLADRNDRDRLEESAKQDLKAMDTEIQTLEPGEAIISTLKVSFPIPAIIHPYEEYLRRLNAEKRPQKSLVEDMESSFEADY